MLGNEHFDQLVACAPINFDTAKVDWAGLVKLLHSQNIGPSDIVAVSWCSFGLGDIEALTDGPALAMVHHAGVLSSTGLRKGVAAEEDYHEINFRQCRRITEVDTADDHGFGKYCIEFLGAGGILTGRLQWSWWSRPFRRSKPRITATAAERDRILNVIKALTP